MVSLMLGLTRFWFAIRMALRDPTFRLLIALTASLLLVGTWVFHQVEGWAYLDSFYFSSITLLTVGYGDFTPETAAGKLLTVFYGFSGIGLLVALLARFAEALIQSHRENEERLYHRLMQAREKIAPSGAGVAQPEPTDPPAAQEERLP